MTLGDRWLRWKVPAARLKRLQPVINGAKARPRKKPQAGTSNTVAIQYARAEKRAARREAGLGEALIEQADRLAGYSARDLTASICGDPPVGFSALDRRGL